MFCKAKRFPLELSRHTMVTDHLNLGGSLAEVHFRNVTDSMSVTTIASECVPVRGRASSVMMGDYQIEMCPVDDLDVLVRIRQWP